MSSIQTQFCFGPYAALALLFAGIGCGSLPRSSVAPAASRSIASEADLSAVLSQKDVLRLLLQSWDVPLTVDSSCSGVGSELSDKTIGDYVAGLLAEFGESSGQNWIEIHARLEPTNAEIWKCSVVFHRVHEEEHLGWGVTFLVRNSDHEVVRDSFRCTGAG